jgi:hypothetical protein
MGRESQPTKNEEVDPPLNLTLTNSEHRLFSTPCSSLGMDLTAKKTFSTRILHQVQIIEGKDENAQS